MTNDFATRKSKPTAKEYLDAPLDLVVERLNNNPCGLQSEEAFIQAVITVRAAKINERLASKLNCLTGALAVATFCLVIIPFFVPSIEKKQLEAQLSAQAKLIEVQKVQISQLEQSVSKITEKYGKIVAQVEEHNKALQLTPR